MANNLFDLQVKVNSMSETNDIGLYTSTCYSSSCYSSTCYSSTCYSSTCYTGQDMCGYTYYMSCKG